jgi:hypothetical protein
VPNDLQMMRDTLTELRGFDLRKIKYPLPGNASAGNAADGPVQLDRYLRRLERLLPSWSNNLSSNYFSHARTLPVTMGL